MCAERLSAHIDPMRTHTTEITVHDSHHPGTVLASGQVQHTVLDSAPVALRAPSGWQADALRDVIVLDGATYIEHETLDDIQHPSNITATAGKTTASVVLRHFLRDVGQHVVVGNRVFTPFPTPFIGVIIRPFQVLGRLTHYQTSDTVPGVRFGVDQMPQAMEFMTVLTELLTANLPDGMRMRAPVIHTDEWEIVDATLLAGLRPPAPDPAIVVATRHWYGAAARRLAESIGASDPACEAEALKDVLALREQLTSAGRPIIPTTSPAPVPAT